MQYRNYNGSQKNLEKSFFFMNDMLVACLSRLLICQHMRKYSCRKYNRTLAFSSLVLMYFVQLNYLNGRFNRKIGQNTLFFCWRRLKQQFLDVIRLDEFGIQNAANETGE